MVPAVSVRPALFRAYPALEQTLPWLALGTFPTPVQPLTALGRAVGNSDLWIKRDDRSGLPYGGNKVRKLEFLLADVKRRGCSRIVTMGAYGSHQILATTLYATRAGLSVCGLVFPQPATEHARDTMLLSIGAGACFHPTSGLFGIPLAGARCAWQHRHQGRWAWIGPGGSSPLGSLGYVSAALELAEQIAAGECTPPDEIVVPFGSGGTAAGLAVGLRLAHLLNKSDARGRQPRNLLNKPNGEGEQSGNLLNKSAGRGEQSGGLLNKSAGQGEQSGNLLNKLAGGRGQAAHLLNKLGETTVVAVRVYDRFFSNARALARLANRTAALIRRAGGPDVGRFRASDFRVVHEFFGGAYGRPTPEAETAIQRARESEGIELETTYTGKALAAVIAAGASGRRTMFWNTFSSAPLDGLPRGDSAALPASLRRLLASGANGPMTQAQEA